MNPAPSVILFSTLSGLGFGFMAFLAAGLVPAQGITALGLWFAGYVLAVGGLVLSAFHLGNPQRALLAFTQWRSSWLSREAIASVATLVLLAPVALSQWLGFFWPWPLGLAAAAMCLGTVFTTSMIYAQLKTVPRWNSPVTPVMFLAYCLTGGTFLTGPGVPSLLALTALVLLQIWAWRVGDRRFGDLGLDLGSASGLGGMGAVRVFEQPHTAPNYLMREMIYVVGRKHRDRLRPLALFLGATLPFLVLFLAPAGPITLVLATVIHLVGAIISRWLFFAEAEHVVGLYYGQR